MLKTCWVGGVIRENESEHDFPENVANDLIGMNRAAATPALAECSLPEPSEGEDSFANPPEGEEDDKPAPVAPPVAVKPAPARRQPASIAGLKSKSPTAS